MPSGSLSVESIAGLDWNVHEIVTRKPVLCIGDKAYMVLPLQSNVGQITNIADKDGKEIQLRMKQIDQITKVSV